MNKLYYKFFYATLFFSVILIVSCSDVQENITTPGQVEIHSEGFGVEGSADFHSFWFKENSWDLKFCQQCHASDYSGAVTGVSCLTCHTQPEGPEACNTCHGDFTNPEAYSPPRDLHDNLDTDSPGVGAHLMHVESDELRGPIDCFECHPSLEDSGEDYVFQHIGVLPADLQFGSLASLSGTPNYNFDNNTCSQVYCHGNFTFVKDSSANSWAYTDSLIIGNSFSPIWNIVDETQAECGTCHALPPTGHISAGTDPDALTCQGCHQAAYDSDGNLDITKHINGESDYQ